MEDIKGFTLRNKENFGKIRCHYDMARSIQGDLLPAIKESISSESENSKKRNDF